MSEIQPFTREALASTATEILRPTRKWFNADLLKFSSNGVSWVIKDFSRRPWLVRNTIGIYYIQREFKTMAAVREVEGMPKGVFHLDKYALCYQFTPGRDLRFVYDDNSDKVGVDFFKRFEQIVHQMHDNNIVHLDVRNGENVIVAAGNEPVLIDFQTALNTRYLPSWLRNFFRKVDISGIYKHWDRIDPASLPDDKRKILDEVNRKRKLWLVNKGPVSKKIHNIFNHPTTRKIFLKLRGPLTIIAFIPLLITARREFFWYGMGISWAGELLQVWCFASLKKQKKLACNGPYAVSRNPMYIGRFFLILGGVIVTGNPYAISIFSLLYYFYMVNRVRREEEILRPIFGKDYQDYCRNVNRFLPSFTKANIKTLPYFKWELFLRNHAHWNILGTLAAWLVLYYFVFIRNA